MYQCLIKIIRKQPFDYQYVEKSWTDHEELKFILTRIYPDLKHITGESGDCSLMELLELIPLNVLFTFSCGRK